MTKPGPTTQLTPELQSRIAGALRDGNARRTAAALGGVSASTFYSWLDKGRAEPQTNYGAFARAVETAEAEFRATMIASIRAQATGCETTYTRTNQRKAYLPVTGANGLVLDENGNPVLQLAGIAESTVTITRTRFNSRLALEWLRRMPANDEPPPEDE